MYVCMYVCIYLSILLSIYLVNATIHSEYTEVFDFDTPINKTSTSPPKLPTRYRHQSHKPHCSPLASPQNSPPIHHRLMIKSDSTSSNEVIHSTPPSTHEEGDIPIRIPTPTYEEPWTHIPIMKNPKLRTHSNPQTPTTLNPSISPKKRSFRDGEISFQSDKPTTPILNLKTSQSSSRNKELVSFEEIVNHSEQPTTHMNLKPRPKPKPTTKLHSSRSPTPEDGTYSSEGERSRGNSVDKRPPIAPKPHLSSLERTSSQSSSPPYHISLGQSDSNTPSPLHTTTGPGQSDSDIPSPLHTTTGPGQSDSNTPSFFHSTTENEYKPKPSAPPKPTRESKNLPELSPSHNSSNVIEKLKQTGITYSIDKGIDINSPRNSLPHYPSSGESITKNNSFKKELKQSLSEAEIRSQHREIDTGVDSNPIDASKDVARSSKLGRSMSTRSSQDRSQRNLQESLEFFLRDEGIDLTQLPYSTPVSYKKKQGITYM